LDLNGKGFDLTDAADGVSRDIYGSGHPVHMSWTAATSDNAFLALPGSDGLVHSGKQLLGNMTAQPVSDAPKGFCSLGDLRWTTRGGNGDGIIDDWDAIFPHCGSGSMPTTMAAANRTNYTNCRHSE
jgi:hypothetical protein